MAEPLAPVTSIKVKLGLLVAASVLAAALLGMLGSATGVPALLTLPVAVALALAVTQLLATGMTSPLRQMTDISRRMAQGDWSGRVHTTSTDEVGRLAAAFNSMAEDLATVDRERRELLATVSHELRTPLTAMTAQLENLADGVVPADADHLGQALAQAERLRDLVGDLLDLSRLQGGVADLDLTEVPLRALLEQSVREVRAAGRTGEFDVRVPPGLVVVADPGRLRQLLVNVLDNAGRHSPPDRPVVVSVGQELDTTTLTIADRGSGVPPGRRERVFERFGTDDGGGTGLGLAIARWVAELHGGTLRFVDPEPGEPGARLLLTLPRTPLTAPRPAAPPTGEAAEPAVTLPPPSGAPGPLATIWPDRPESGVRTVLAALAAGLFGGLAMSFTRPGISWTLLLVAAGAATLATSRRRAEPWTLVCSGLALLLVLPVTLIDAGGIGVLGVLAAAAVFLVGLTGAWSPSGVVLTGLAWPLSAVRGLPWLGRSLRPVGISGGTVAVARTLVWSLLGLVAFVALFASADAVFGTWVDALVPSLSLNEVVGRLFVAAGIFALTLAAGYLGLNPPDVDHWSHRAVPAARRFEWLVPVLVVDAVFLAFLASQLSAFLGGHDYVERTTGLTYADYVHQGFGQLTVATALTLLVVGVASRRAGDAPGDRGWRWGSLGLLCLLALVVVASALHRMSLYQEAYGFTTLRLTVDVFEGWLGFVLLALMVLGALGRGRWVVRTAVASGAVAVLGLTAINPDAWVAGQNIDRYEATGKLDLDYLQSLSADAAPVIVDRLPERVSACVLQLLPHHVLTPEVRADPRAWNLGRARAREALARIRVEPLPTTSTDPCAPVWEAYAHDPAPRVG